MIQVKPGTVYAKRPDTISNNEKRLTGDLIERGINTQFTGTSVGVPIDLVVGLDLGTSATKVVIRAPYMSSASPHALPVPSYARAESNLYLWQTIIWLGADRRFYPWPEPDAIPIEGIKTGLMGKTPQAGIARLNENVTISAADAAIAYMCFMFRFIRGWVLETKANTYHSAPLRWRTNVGLPAATYDDVLLRETYRRVAAAAWLLSQTNSDITIDTVRDAYRDLRAVNASLDPSGRQELGIETIPEVAAEVAGFARSTQRREGLYVLIDIGASTLDVCTFRLHTSAPGTDRYSMFVADVQLLGAEALRWWLEGGGDHQNFDRAVSYAMQRVVWVTKCKRERTAEEWKTSLPIFLCGGGAGSSVHYRTANAMSSWLADTTRSSVKMPIIGLERPEPFDADITDGDFHRLGVAWGLSYAETDIGNLAPPSSIPDHGPLPYRDTSGNYIEEP